MNVVALIFFVVWGIGFERIARKHSVETLSSLFGFSPANTTFKGYVYMTLWTIALLFLLGLIGLAAK